MLAFNMNFEEQPISQEIIDNAIEMITSSKILNEAFKNWSDAGRDILWIQPILVHGAKTNNCLEKS